MFQYGPRLPWGSTTLGWHIPDKPWPLFLKHQQSPNQPPGEKREHWLAGEYAKEQAGRAWNQFRWLTVLKKWLRQSRYPVIVSILQGGRNV
jgi:hypothetical protein